MTPINDRWLEDLLARELGEPDVGSVSALARCIRLLNEAPDRGELIEEFLFTILLKRDKAEALAKEIITGFGKDPAYVYRHGKRRSSRKR